MSAVGSDVSRSRPGRPFHLVAYTDADSFGGAETSLATVLSLLGPDVRVSVMGVNQRVVEALVERRPGATAVVVPPVRGKSDVRPIIAHVRALRRLRPDVVHVNLRTPYSCQYGLLAGLLAPRARVVAVEHLPLHSDSRLRRWFKRQADRRLAAHIAVGERVARAIEHDASLRPGSIAVILNGVPEQSVGKPCRLAPGAVVGSVGRLEHQKGYDVLLDALALLPGVTAVLVGDGVEREALERRARELNVADRFVIAGWKDPVAPYLHGFDVFVLPSRFEALPLSILEAMAAGRAVVATDVGSIAESVAHEETGLLVQPDDAESLAAALARLLDDDQLRQRLGEKGHEVWATRFSAAAMVTAYEQLYRSLVE